ncbi:hypothetical protein KFE96_03015 [Kordiimonas sp. SCSIO 12603]|uniref:hypothetical protein n=1 Tax=Kordiimonas sp. SCSIO 12603 TaxID=2829596 RepID=UPI002103C900|nr:hypothetical protein [Kordiimonas sp. SCSIO 12603]UTW59294.1 hypothetical protein KFE96_03015 [Kordiimonas sp. SCSIO 12603]
MDGIVFFGPHSIDITAWTDIQHVDNALNNLKSLIRVINKSGYAKVKVPEDWAEEPNPDYNFWDGIEIVVDGNSQLMGHIFTELYDQTFSECIDTKTNYSDAVLYLTDNNPDEKKLQYYGAFKLENFWPSISEEIHVSDENQLNKWAHVYLAKAPINEDNYTDRCQKIFPNLIFHHDFPETLKSHGSASPAKDAKGKKIRSYAKAPVPGIQGFSENVTIALAALNTIQLEGKTTEEILLEVRAASGFDCTPQGSNKERLKFLHTLSDGTQKTVNCEFHIKFSSNNTNDGVEYKERVYFGFVEDQDCKRILVAHSGTHI